MSRRAHKNRDWQSRLSFWFGRAWVGAEDLHFKKFPGEAAAAGLGTSIEKHQSTGFRVSRRPCPYGCVTCPTDLGDSGPAHNCGLPNPSVWQKVWAGASKSHFLDVAEASQSSYLHSSSLSSVSLLSSHLHLLGKRCGPGLQNQPWHSSWVAGHWASLASCPKLSGRWRQAGTHKSHDDSNMVRVRHPNSPHDSEASRAGPAALGVQFSSAILS